MKKYPYKNNILLKKFKNSIEDFPNLKKDDRILVSVSGGVDSIALLFLLNELDIFDLIVVHINHKLREESDFDEKFVRDLSRDLNIPFRSKSLDPKSKSKRLSKEEWGRLERYLFLNETLKKEKANWIMTAHHANDQAETILMNLSRKSGVIGLRGISRQRDNILRPLLKFTKADILKFSEKSGLLFQEDKTNLDNSIPRNFLRNKILGPWESAFPQVITGISSSSKFFCEWSDGLDHMISKFIIPDLKVTDNTIEISYELLKPFPIIVKTRLIQLITNSTNSQWSKHTLNMLAQFLEKSRSGVFHSLPNGWRILRDRSSIKVQFQSDHFETTSVIIEKDTPTYFNSYRYEVNLDSSVKNMNYNNNYEIVDWEKLKNTTLKLRLWKKGDVFQPLGMKGHQKVSDFLINQKTDCIEKEFQSVLTANGKIVWVCGKRLSNWAKITKDTNQIAVLSRGKV